MFDNLILIKYIMLRIQSSYSVVETSCIFMNSNEMQICHVNTLRNVADLLRKISIQNDDQEVVPIKQHFLTAREKVRVLYLVFFSILVGIF